MKSTAGLSLACAAILCCPSLRLLLISETTKLSKDFIKAFRGFWERGSNPAYVRFQYFFPEYCIEPGDGSVQAFTSPMRGFVLPQETAEAASLEVAAAGRRADLEIFDDPISEKNTGNDDARAKGLNTFYALLKLREAGAGIVLTFGTPWVMPPPGGVGDLYYELMRNNEKDPQHSLAVKVEPAWILKPESAHLFPQFLNALTEEHVQELTCPSRWSFADLIKEARKSITTFQTQHLCQYVENEESKWIPTFTIEELQSKVRPLGFFDTHPTAMVVAAVDTAFSVAATADRSSICIAKIIQYQGKNVCFIVDVIANRWKYSDLAIQIVEAFRRYGVARAVIERTGPWQELQEAVQRQAVLRGYPLPMIQWKISTGTGTPVSAKVQRVKGFETLFNNDQVFFAAAPWNEAFFKETAKFNGSRSNNSRKDDQIDSASMLGVFIRTDTGVAIETSEAQREFEEQARIQAYIRGTYDQVFGAPAQYQPQPTVAEPEPVNPLYSNLGRFGLVRK